MSTLQRIQARGLILSTVLLSLQRALVVALFLRLSTSILLAFVSGFIQVAGCSVFACDEAVYSEMQENSQFSRLFLAPWYRWDTTHYLTLSQNGYQSDQIDKTTWPPFYPVTVKLISLIFPPMASALILSTLSLFAAFFILHRYISITWDSQLADHALVYYAVFPTAFFLVAGYTESTFLFFALACLISIRARHWLAAGVTGALATLTRFQGIFLVLPFLLEAYYAYKQNPDIFRSVLPRLGITISLIPLTFFLNALYIHEVVQAPWPWLTKSGSWNTHLSFPFSGIFYNFAKLFSSSDLHGSISCFIDLMAILLFIFLLIKKVPGMPSSFRLYGWIMLLPSLTMINEWGTMTGVSRFVLPVFPAVITLAWLLRKKKIKLIWIFLSYLSQCFLLIIFYNWGWIA